MSTEETIIQGAPAMTDETPNTDSDDDTTPVEAKLMANYACTFDEAREAGIAAREELGLAKNASARGLERAASVKFEQLHSDKEPSNRPVAVKQESARLVQEIIDTEEKIESVKKQLSDKGLLAKASDATDPESDDDEAIKTKTMSKNKKKNGLFSCCSAADQQVVA